MTRRMEVLFSVAVVVGLVALVAVAISGPRDLGVAVPSPTVTAAASPTVAASPAPSAAPTHVASSSPSPSATAAYAYLAGHADEDRFAIRTEADGRTLREIRGRRPAISPDGRAIAYWRTGPGSAPDFGPPHVLTVHTVATGAERTLVQLGADSRGGPIVWAADGTGLLYEEHSAEFLPAPGPGGGPRRSTLVSYDLTATQAQGATASDLVLTDGRVFVPVTWDRASQIASAVTTGEGGYAVEYMTWDRRVLPAGAQAVKFARVPFAWLMVAHTVRASSDAKHVLGVGGTLRIWQTADLATAREIPTPMMLWNAHWSPTAPRDVAVAYGNTLGVFTWGDEPIRTREVRKAADRVGIFAWRSDGSAVLIGVDGSVMLVDIETSRSTASAWITTTTPIVGAVLLR